MTLRGTDPESYITEYTLLYEDSHVVGCVPQKALCGGIPCPFLEPLALSWSHFVGIYRQNLTTPLEN